MAKKPGKRNLRTAIHECGGVIAEVANHLRVSRQTVYNWLDHYDMRDEVMAARTNMRTVANDVIYQRLMSSDEDKAFEAARHVSLHLNEDGELLMLSPAVLRVLAARGISASEAVRQFEALVLAQVDSDK